MLGGFSLGISGVFVIESLRPDDKLRTGVEVHASAVSPFGRRAGVYVDPVRFANKLEDLLDHLATIADIVAAKKLKPILQIECHGSAAGLEIGRKLVSWEQLVPALCELNRASRMNLFVIAGACEGAHLLTALTHAFHSHRRGAFRGRAPVRACWGHFGVVWDRPLLDALTEFYRCVLGTGDSLAAWRAISAGHVITADNIFRSARDVLRKPDRLESSVDRLQMRMGGRRDVVRNRYLDLLETQRKRYLWLDDFPENAIGFDAPHSPDEELADL